MIIVVTMIVLIAVITVLFFMFKSDSYVPERFDRAKWEVSHERYLMVDDLVDNNMLIGKTKKEIYDMLGEWIENYPKDSGKSQWIYYLGNMPCFGADIDGAILFITFDNGVAVNVFVKC
ncbi:MAG TPA: hypothetical protein PLB12_00190 [Candidatus Goldiibacteriota bacterium]|nr:hypothetical protein [Candidatus Goldiibacteriota bacterium]